MRINTRAHGWYLIHEGQATKIIHDEEMGEISLEDYRIIHPTKPEEFTPGAELRLAGKSDPSVPELVSATITEVED